MFIKQPFDSFLGFQYERLSEDRVRVTLPVQDLFVNSAGVIHGGVISSLADVAMSNLLPADEEGIQQIVTVDLNVSFLRGATGKTLIADAELVKTGKTLIHAACMIYGEDGTAVASAKGVFFRK
ncbi:PaaI family thioesterase [Edaphobacillus lindanitolerans]|uniref:Acyl-CoA thioesterase n=1 Tax=Edaphobacillus lindanitolerans TaxID=550447 RepID=A0A1U7PPQ0_9BACI|nr:PaaI family thioesterase [Edaphobacillus lindanitolerans]SIT87943.1 acyl-CoA thioesterase [Edaphobacillus lindanitolerans]